ncbi:hypothetical protein LTSESEN_0958, partial [Salmonella enterica subsp. enterica serovar Senftenberg str. A4-543]
MFDRPLLLLASQRAPHGFESQRNIFASASGIARGEIHCCGKRPSP